MITQKFTSDQVLALRNFLSQAQRYVILTHMSPDGDAMGSSLAMYWYLRSHGKQATVIVPNAFPSFLAWLPGAQEDLVYDEQQDACQHAIDECQALICTDFNELKRIGGVGMYVEQRKTQTNLPILMIDHHLCPSRFADLVFSYPESPSACEIVYRLLYALQGEQHQPFSQEIATCIYTGMMTDTGNFSFNSNYPEMYEIVGDLVRSGVNKDAIYNLVFNQYTADRMRLMGYCLYQKMRIFPEHHVALIALSGKELFRFNFKAGDAEGIVNLPLQISDVYYSCFMREDKIAAHEVDKANGSKKKVKISFRSQGNRPVNKFASDYFNGGGHANAAGGEFFGPLSEAVDMFIAHYKDYFTPAE